MIKNILLLIALLGACTNLDIEPQTDSDRPYDDEVELNSKEQASCVAPCRYTPTRVYFNPKVGNGATWNANNGCIGSSNIATFHSFQYGGSKARYALPQLCIKHTGFFNSCTVSGAVAQCDGQVIYCPYPSALRSYEADIVGWSGESYSSPQPGAAQGNWNWNPPGSYTRHALWNIAWPGYVQSDAFINASVTGSGGGKMAPVCIYNSVAGHFDMDMQ